MGKTISYFGPEMFCRAGRLAMIRGVTAVSPIAIALFAGPNRLPPEAVSEADAEVQGNTTSWNKLY
jgi:hypothetical protein